MRHNGAWEALARGAWEDALVQVREAEDAEALEIAGIAHWWLDDADETLDARERAYRLYRERGDAQGAARVAGALAWDSILFGGRTAVARGWLERGARLLAEEPVCAEHAWLAVREAEVALASGEPPVARMAAARAIATASHLGLEDIEVVGRSLEGLALVNEGSVDEGMRRLDESAVAARAGDVKDLMWIGKVCCNLISACDRVGDVERATQWCAEVKEFAQRWELRSLFNVCRTQYASVLLQTGAWTEAEAELEAALEVFAGGRRGALVDGTARLGELRRRQGRLDEARSLFGQSERSWTSRLGVVELALDEDDTESALSHAERLERATAGSRQLDRIAVLALLVRAAIASGRVDVATEASRELDELAAGVGTKATAGAAAHAAGLAAQAQDDLETARTRLEDAVDLFGLAGSPYERARARLDLARALLQLDQPTRGRSEASLARDAFRELDALHELGAALQLLDPCEQPGPLTKREREVLAYVAEGRSNREIADELVVSPHTVHRHVANILRKLGEPTRAAAASRATRDGLV